MKLLPLFLFLSYAICVQAQHFEVFTGVGFNNFHAKSEDDSHFSSGYQAGLASGLGIGLFGKTGIGHEMGLTLKFMTIKGGIDISSQAHGAGYQQRLDAEIKTLELGLYPLTFSSLNEKLEIRLGFEFAYLRSGRLKGVQDGWYLSSDNSTYPPTPIYVSESKPIDLKLKENFTDLSAFFCLKMGYDFRIASNFSLLPKLHLGYGFGKRFTDKVGVRPKNWVAMLELAVRRHF